MDKELYKILQERYDCNLLLDNFVPKSSVNKAISMLFIVVAIIFITFLELKFFILALIIGIPSGISLAKSDKKCNKEEELLEILKKYEKEIF
jgi:hypothetical protein